MIREQKGMVERLGEIRKGRRGLRTRGDRERDKKTIRREGGPERPLFNGISRSDPAM